MKSVRFAYTVFALLFVAVFINSLSVGKTIDSISRELAEAEEEDMKSAEKEYERIYENYKKYEFYVSLTVDHDDLANIEDAFSEIIGAAKADDAVGVVTTKSRLCDYLRHVKRLSGINIDSIF